MLFGFLSVHDLFLLKNTHPTVPSESQNTLPHATLPHGHQRKSIPSLPLCRFVRDAQEANDMPSRSAPVGG